MDDPTAADPTRGDDRLVGADRVVAILMELADHPLGVTLDELATRLRSSRPTVHRALATLRRAGLADMQSRGVYVLGDEYLRLAFRNLDGRPDTARVQPLLRELAGIYGETSHYAVLTGSEVVYRAKTDPAEGAVRLTSVIGGRNPASRTAVGKALLSRAVRDRAGLAAVLGDGPFEPKTPNTLTTLDALLADLTASRERGYAVDDQENEVGINCVAIPIHLDGATAPTGAVSVSALSFRTPLADLVAAVPAISDAVVRHLGAHALLSRQRSGVRRAEQSGAEPGDAAHAPA
jgi:IclR family transcriptional regulator, acetate operon repressor